MAKRTGGTVGSVPRVTTGLSYFGHRLLISSQKSLNSYSGRRFVDDEVSYLIVTVNFLFVLSILQLGRKKIATKTSKKKRHFYCAHIT